MTKLKLGSKRGDSIVIVLIVCALAVTVLFGLFGILAKYSRLETDEIVRSAGRVISLSLISQLSNDLAWQQITTDSTNAILSCIGTDCSVCVSGVCTGQSGPIRVLDAFGTVFYDPVTSSTAGLRMDGSQCAPFGTDDCPFRFTVTWTAICPPVPPCPNPVSQITLVGQYQATSGMTFNNANFSMQFSRYPPTFTYTLPTVPASVYNFNLMDTLGNPTVAANYIVTIPAGVTVGSNSPYVAAFSSGHLPPGSNLTIINKGRIYGAGGDGGQGGPLGDCSIAYPLPGFGNNRGRPGQDGGTAIEVFNYAVIDSTAGDIWGGGGGGGGGTAGNAPNAGGGGGGGAGSSPGRGGPVGYRPASPGNIGTTTTFGVGGAPIGGGTGGNGGGIGLPGQRGGCEGDGSADMCGGVFGCGGPDGGGNGKGLSGREGNAGAAVNANGHPISLLPPSGSNSVLGPIQ